MNKTRKWFFSLLSFCEENFSIWNLKKMNFLEKRETTFVRLYFKSCNILRQNLSTIHKRLVQISLFYHYPHFSCLCGGQLTLLAPISCHPPSEVISMGTPVKIDSSLRFVSLLSNLLMDAERVVQRWQTLVIVSWSKLSYVYNGRQTNFCHCTRPRQT